MLSGFNLKEGETFEAFQTVYTHFIKDLTSTGVIAGAGPLGTRVADTPMDTDGENPREYFSVISFLDRAHLDAAYAFIEARSAPGTATHIDMYRRISHSVFTCWQDEG